jgi:RNA polymerase sigma-B factor
VESDSCLTVPTKAGTGDNGSFHSLNLSSFHEIDECPYFFSDGHKKYQVLIRKDYHFLVMANPVRHSAEVVWNRCRQRSIDERNHIATANDRLALKIAHRMAGQCAEPIEDLIQMARIGLLKAAAKFDPTKGAAFSSFAVPYIQGEIQHFLRDHWGSVKVPRRTFETAARVRKVQRDLKGLGRTADTQTVAVALGMSNAKWRWVEQATQRQPVASLDEMLHPDESDDLEGLEQDALRKSALQQVAKLPRLKRECVVEFYFKQLSEEAIARRHSLSVVDVQALLKEAIAHLQAQLNEA